MSLLVRWLITAIALFVAAALVPGIHVRGPAWLAYGGMAVVLSLVNAFLRPILKLLSCPFIILSLGFFLLIINAVTLWLSSALCVALGIDYRIETFWAAFLGALIVSLVSFVLSLMARQE
jgi:putative membrane protein